jgi:NADH:ubiquinone oxidoreductase subunit F (NADH-binding)
VSVTRLPALRLLADYYELGRPVALRDHLARYGRPPVPRGAAHARGRDQMIRMIEDAGLTGRGGGAFPTARKMRAVARSRQPSVVVVNASESEPASGKDRLLLRAAPHLVLDGAVLAAYAVGAREVIVCMHAGGNTAAELGFAVTDRSRPGTVPTRIVAVPPRYVAGEETSLMTLINKGEAVPAFTPPRPFERGVGGRPTLVCNAETYAHIGLIIRYGPGWFRAQGAPDAPGTALFTVSGAVARPGVIEAPLGTSVADLLELAGGACEPLQATLTGGYGGTWLPLERLRTPTTPAALAGAGATIGPGIVVALSRRTCGLAEAARVLAWLAEESAGQCGPCVLGLAAVSADFAAVAGCRADASCYQRLRRRLSIISGRGACRHPDGAIRFAESALRVFGPHLGAHARANGCPAARHAGVLPLPQKV